MHIKKYKNIKKTRYFKEKNFYFFFFLSFFPEVFLFFFTCSLLVLGLFLFFRFNAA